MFFSIDKTKQDNFVEFFQFGKFFVSVDSGWSVYEIKEYVVVYKGYADYHHLRDILDIIISETEPKQTGNFCAIIFNKIKNTICIKSDRYRSFPIYVDSGHKITNLTKQKQIAWTDSLITIKSNLEVIENKFDAIGNTNLSPISLDKGIEILYSILDKKTKAFLELRSELPLAFQKPIYVFLSGGVDSLLVYSFLQKYTKDYKLINCSHIDFTDFWLLNSDDITNNWGYKQIHHWVNPCVLTSGTPGDEFMLRSPVTSNIFLQNHGTNLDEINIDSKNLHYSYFKTPKNLQIVNQLSSELSINQKLTKKQLVWKLCNIICNDWQHWHLENTLTWTPLRDLDIFKTILQVPYEFQIKQILDSFISKTLIKEINPEFINLISDQKNTGSMMKNLVNFYKSKNY